MGPIDPANNHLFQDDSNKRNHHHGSDNGQREGSEVLKDRIGLHPFHQVSKDGEAHIGPPCKQGTVGKIQDIHETKYDTYTGSHKEQKHTHGKACDGQRHVSLARDPDEGQEKEDNCTCYGELSAPSF